MLIQKAFKYRLRTEPEMEQQLRMIAGCCRFVWNKALALQKERFTAGEKKLGYAGLCKELTSWKQQPETAFLCEAPIHVLQQSLKDLDRAYQNFFAHRAEFPVFKKRGQHDSFRNPDGFTVDTANGRIKLPKIGWLRYRDSRKITGTPRNVTISLYAGPWYASVQTEQAAPERAPRSRNQPEVLMLLQHEPQKESSLFGRGGCQMNKDFVLPVSAVKAWVESQTKKL